ncbi:sulfite exporter TauE/SafE family protein [Deltaproteobacteria bacterium OttesenSCG-928-M10]|nr:sulfite exporter TauE/SafE family protein [Deltaproteobacteria bacterium OttesenSCG-928-M10]
MYFPVADIDINPLIPLVAGLAVSAVSAPAGVSGGFLILPIYLNFLNFTGLAVSPTNFLYNIVAMPAGLWRLHREKRLMWGLGWLIMAGCLPGIFAGTVLRCTWLKNAADFKVFVALVLAALGLGLLRNLIKGDSLVLKAEKAFLKNRDRSALVCVYGAKSIRYEFGGETFTVSTPKIALVSLAVGLIGGIYGIGGAAVIAPVLIGLFQMPIYVVNGASLLAGWAGAVFGLFSYTVFWPFVSGAAPVWPDVGLGVLFGLGGMIGVYLGSAFQRFLPPRPIKLLMLGLITVLAAQNLGLF